MNDDERCGDEKLRKIASLYFRTPEPSEIQENVMSAKQDSIILKMNYEDFLEWSDENVLAEWRDGEVIVQMPPKLIHQAVSDFLHNRHFRK